MTDSLDSVDFIDPAAVDGFRKLHPTTKSAKDYYKELMEGTPPDTDETFAGLGDRMGAGVPLTVAPANSGSNVNATEVAERVKEAEIDEIKAWLQTCENTINSQVRRSDFTFTLSVTDDTPPPVVPGIPDPNVLITKVTKDSPWAAIPGLFDGNGLPAAAAERYKNHAAFVVCGTRGTIEDVQKIVDDMNEDDTCYVGQEIPPGAQHYKPTDKVLTLDGRELTDELFDKLRVEQLESVVNGCRSGRAFHPEHDHSEWFALEARCLERILVLGGKAMPPDPEKFIRFDGDELTDERFNQLSITQLRQLGGGAWGARLYHPDQDPAIWLAFETRCIKRIQQLGGTLV